MLAAAALIALAPAGAAAQVTITAVAGVAGGDVVGAMLPVRVEVSNSGGPARGLIEVQRAGPDASLMEKHILRLDPLPGSSRQQYWFYLPPRRDGTGTPVQVRLAMEGRPEQAQVLNTGSISADVSLVYEIGDGPPVRALERPARAALPQREQGRQIQVRHLPPALIPDNALGLTPAELIILNGVDPTVLAVEQRRAITEAVSRGVSLLVHPGSNLTLLRDPFYADLLPAEVSGAWRATGATGPAGTADELQVGFRPGTVLAVLKPLPGREVKAICEGRPALVRGMFGSGLVFLAAWGARDARLEAAETEAVWQSILSGASENRTRIRPLILAASAALQAGQRGGHPPALPTLLFLIAYAVVLGPLHQIWLKRLGRESRVWITLPAIVLLSCAAAVAATRAGPYSQGQLSRATVLRTYSGSAIAGASAAAALAGPSRFIRKVASPVDGVVPVLRQAVDVRVGYFYDWTQGPALQNLRLTGGLGSIIQAPSSLDLGGAVSFKIGDSGIVELINGSRFNLTDATLNGDPLHSLGSVAAGASIRLPPSPAAGPAGSSPVDERTAELRRRIVAALRPAEYIDPRGAGPMLTAWVEKSQPVIEFEPAGLRSVEATLLVVLPAPAARGAR